MRVSNWCLDCVLKQSGKKVSIRFLEISGACVENVLSVFQVGIGQARTGQVGKCQVRTGQVRTAQFRTGQVGIGHVRTGQGRIHLRPHIV